MRFVCDNLGDNMSILACLSNLRKRPGVKDDLFFEWGGDKSVEYKY